MRRRSFLATLGKCAVALTALPAAIRWHGKPPQPPILPFVLQDNVCRPNPEWVSAPYEIVFYGFDQFGKPQTFQHYWNFRFRNLRDARHWIARVDIDCPDAKLNLQGHYEKKIPSTVFIGIAEHD